MMDNFFSNFSDEPKKQPRHRKVTFKKYEIKQDFLLPPSTEDYLPVNHIARLISKIVDNIDLTSIIAKYSGGGTSAFHPRMMLKVWLLGFIKKIYTSRKLEKALHENIAFMWISGRQTPDFKTLSNFRLLLADDIKTIFKHIVQMGLELGIIEGKDIFIDHTKMQANANPYKMIWKKSVDKKLSKIDEELEILFNFINELNEKEDSKYGNEKLDNIKEDVFSKENIDSLIGKINQDLKEGGVNLDDAKESKEKLKRANELLDRKKKFETQKKILGERNSYSKTDTDASAMKMKRSEEIKPGYNEGVVTENSFITSFDVSQNASDSVSFQKLINETIENIGHNPQSISADAGYGSSENYTYLNDLEIENFVKYPGWFRENKFSGKFTIKNFNYNEEKNNFTCLNNETLSFNRFHERKSANGFKEVTSIYSANKNSCSKCPLKPWCTEFEFKNLHVNWNLQKQKEIVRENLNSAKGILKRKQRAYDVETIFADRKWNQSNRRYLLRGLPKVTVEAGLFSITHNIKKIFYYIHHTLYPDFKLSWVI